jgi:hypothetical protein
MNHDGVSRSLLYYRNVYRLVLERDQALLVARLLLLKKELSPCVTVGRSDRDLIGSIFD